MRGESSAMALASIFDDKWEGHFFQSGAVDYGPEIAGLAKANTAPDIYAERQMRGKEWDEPKMLEIEKLRKLGGFVEVSADDKAIAHMRAVESMFAGRDKRHADGRLLKKAARCVARGDLHSKFYNVTSNDKTSPVVRNSSLMAVDAVACVRGQEFCPYDVPGAYLQGVQLPSEQTLIRPPVGFRKWDERGVEISCG